MATKMHRSTISSINGDKSAYKYALCKTFWHLYAILRADQLCTFHLNQNAMKHLGYLGDDFSAFSNDFIACMLGYKVETELIEAWKSLMNFFQLEDNAWVGKTWDLREKWAHVHMKWSYNVGMKST